MKLDIFDYERPVGIQILEEMRGNGPSSKIVTTVRPDIVDINFGCPVKKWFAKALVLVC
jgi:tRNA-dihydrouridine synthase